MLGSILACALVLATPASLLAGETSDAEAATSSPLLERVACIGASASGGFNLEKFGPDWTLAHVLRAASITPLDDCLDAADVLFYLQPAPKGKAMVERALSHRPTLLFALDFPFWYGYGNQRGADARLAFLETCLGQLAQFDCPLVIADFPDMHHALEAEFPVIARSQVPAPETLKKLNARLRAWAGERENVTLVPLARFLVDIRAGRTVRARGNEWAEDQLEDLIQGDALHPTREGMVALTLLALDRLIADHPDLEGAFLTDREEIAERARGSRKTSGRPVGAGARK